ncbi:DUF4350 domain-containing protein [Kitasatospora sp. NBC_00315]|uniref:DUF4350 domain-containing protein n=1 Tax=Kitasatospora sp. NBC_00315 TaxID=2975963 RepID=UPI00324EE95A
MTSTGIPVPAQATGPGPVPAQATGPVPARATGPAPDGPGAPEEATRTSLAPTGRGLWLRSRWYLLGVGVLLVAGLLLAGLRGDSSYPALDPRSGDPSGTRAVARLLERQGLTVDTTTDAAQHPAGPDTLVVPDPDRLSPQQLRDLADAHHARLVLISPGDDTLAVLAPAVRQSVRGDMPDYAAPTGTPALCSLPDAVRAGTAYLGELLYQPGRDGQGCYPRHSGYALVREPAADGGDVIVLGSGGFLTNDKIDEDGNASLALGLLGSRPHLTWFLPDLSVDAPVNRQKELTDFIPDGWYWAGLQLAVAALLAAAWRGRRLGPVVSEDLPVVVRAAETTEGRARLYRRAKARGRAADALRRATLHRLAPVLGVPLVQGVPDPTALCAAVTDRLAGGRAPGAVQVLLYGPPPTDDAALLRLADDLDALERQVRQP